MYKILKKYKKNDEESLLRDLIWHHEHTLAINCTRINARSALTAASLAIKDRVLELLNDSQHHILQNNCKRVYFMSIDYLLGRLFQNAIQNLNIEEATKSAFKALGISMEESVDLEIDPALGTAGLGRLSACLLDSFACLDLPASGYGIRYTYGTFKQIIKDGCQVELADYWLSEIYPWEIERSDIIYEVHFGGTVDDDDFDNTKPRKWIWTESVLAKAYDIPIPGFGTLNTTYLRLWKSIPDHRSSLNHKNPGDYYSHVKAKREAELISAVLYPNNQTTEGKILKLKQEYFFVAASIQDMIHNFRLKNGDLKFFASKVAIQLNDIHPALGMIELLRVLIDLHKFEFGDAWQIVQDTFSYTNHSILTDSLENLEVSILAMVLPRHMELVYLINYFWLEKARYQYNQTLETLSSLSLVDESVPKKIKMGHLCVVGAHSVNGVSEIHTKILTSKTFQQFAVIFPDKFVNITNGVSTRRWICEANPLLSDFYSDQLGSNDFILNFSLISLLEVRVESQIFQKKWQKIKRKNKIRIVEWVSNNLGVEISEDFMFDVMMKKVHLCKRQLLFLLFILYRFIVIKKFNAQMREKVVKRVFFLSGKANPTQHLAKKTIEFCHAIANLINKDPDVSKLMRIVFLPNYNVSTAELIIPGTDLSEHISLVGTEASGTSNMKAAMNGALIIGTRDGANLEIEEHVGSENIFMFGVKFQDAENLNKKVFLKDAKWGFQ